MATPLQAYSGMNIKGGLLRARFLYVALNHGPDAWSRILARLPDEARDSMSEIDVDNWYPLGLLDEIDRAIAGEIGGKPEEVFDNLGEFSAQTSLSGPYSSLLNPDIQSFLTQSALIHRAYQDFGSAQYESLSETSGMLTIRYDTAPPQSFCISGTSYFRHAIEMCGARSAHVTHTRCRSRGDAVCEFYMIWQP